MNSDFRVAVTFADHPKTLRLVQRLGPIAIGCLIRLWAWVATHRPDGDLQDIEDSELDAIARFEGFALAAAEVGFLDGVPGHRAVHNWGRHNAYACGAEARSRKARVNARKRWEMENREIGTGEGNSEHAASNATSSGLSNATSSANSNAGSNGNGRLVAVRPHDAPVPIPVPVNNSSESEGGLPAERAGRRSVVPPPGCKTFQDECFRTWKAANGSEPPWDATEYAALAKAYRKLGGSEEATVAWSRFVSDSTPFFAGHDPKKFVSSLGRWKARNGPAKRGEPAAQRFSPADYHRKPQRESPAAKAERRRAELLAEERAAGRTDSEARTVSYRRWLEEGNGTAEERIRILGPAPCAGQDVGQLSAAVGCE